MRHALALSLIALLAACAGPAPEPPEVGEVDVAGAVQTPAPIPTAEQEAEAVARTRDAAKGLGGSLKAALVAELGGNGPVAAASVCSEQAVPMTAAVAAESGVVVGRSSLRLRNPDNAAPDWVMAWLAGQGERKAETSQGFARVDEVDGVAMARVLKPLPIEGPCLLCHGGSDALAEGIPELLAERYPQDQATGYALGDLRGALWAEGPVLLSE